MWSCCGWCARQVLSSCCSFFGKAVGPKFWIRCNPAGVRLPGHSTPWKLKFVSKECPKVHPRFSDCAWCLNVRFKCTRWFRISSATMVHRGWFIASSPDLFDTTPKRFGWGIFSRCRWNLNCMERFLFLHNQEWITVSVAMDGEQACMLIHSRHKLLC